jgi:uncharacterized membrane protein
MAQDPNQQSQYSSGYSGYSAQSDTSNPQPGQDYWQQSGYQPGSEQQSTSGQYGQPGQSGQQQQQQYGSYQPPFGATGGMNAHDPTSTGLSGRTEALLSYVLGWVSGLIFFVIERKNRFVRFNAAQSFLFFGSTFVLLLVIRLLGFLIGLIPFIGGTLAFVVNLVLSPVSFIIVLLAALVWIFLLFQSYRGRTVRLPFFGNYAESMVARTMRRRKGA